MPKLLIKVFGDPGEDMCELEEAKYLIDFFEPDYRDRWAANTFL